MSCCLIICRTAKGLRKVSRIRPAANTDYVLASDDPAVQRAAAALPWVSRVSFIEKIESYYPIAADVIRILGQVNQWLRSFADEKQGLSLELLEWTHNVEGGFTVQRIQDALLLIRSYELLIESFGISEVLITDESGSLWEDRVLVATAIAHSLPVRTCRTRFRLRWGGMLEWGRLIARNIYHIWNILRVKFRPDTVATRNMTPRNIDVMFQLCSSSRKHVENIAPLMTRLMERGLRTVALCWSAGQRFRVSGADQIRASGLMAHQLERHVSLLHLLRSTALMLRVWQRICSRREEFIQLNGLKYGAVALGAVLWPSIRFFVVGELPMRVRFSDAVRKYFRNGSPSAMKLWGVNEFFEGLAASRELARYSQPLYFAYWLGNANVSPYYQRAPHLGLFLATNDRQREIAHTAYGIVREKISVIGQVWHERLRKFREQFSSADSRRALKLSHRFSFVLAYDASAVMRGAYACREQYETTGVLIQLAARHPKLAVVTKPHPVHRRGFLEEQIARADLKNVFVIDKEESPAHWLNSAHLLVTKASTLVLEAMLLDRPVLSVLLDREDNYKIFGDAVEYFYETECLFHFIEGLLNRQSAYAAWAEAQISRQREYLEQYFPPTAETPADLAVTALCRALAEFAHIEATAVLCPKARLVRSHSK